MCNETIPAVWPVAVRLDPDFGRTPPVSGMQQVVTHNGQTGQRAGHEKAVRVLGQPAITDLPEAEHTLDHANAVLTVGLLGRVNFYQ